MITPEQKNISALQKEVNRYKKEATQIQSKIKWYKRQLTLDSQFKIKLRNLYPEVYKELIESSYTLDLTDDVIY